MVTEVGAASKSDELLALRKSRHRALAHTATPNEPYKGKARQSEYGDERRLIEKTILIVEQAGAFIGYTYPTPFNEQRRVRREHATNFWNSAFPTT